MTEFEETSKKIQDLVDEVFKQGIGVGYDHGLEVGTQNGYRRGYENGKKSKQTDDLISRQAVQDYIAKYLSQYLYNDVRETVEVIDEYIGELPSVNPQPCNDAISKQAVINACEQSINILEAVDRIMDLPSVEQEPKTGHWIEKDGFDGDVYYDCSECGESWTTIEGTPWDNVWNYCPNCGARMESEDKE